MKVAQKNDSFIGLVARWVLVIIVAIVLLGLCARVSDMGGDRDHFRGVERVFD